MFSTEFWFYLFVIDVSKKEINVRNDPVKAEQNKMSKCSKCNTSEDVMPIRTPLFLIFLDKWSISHTRYSTLSGSRSRKPSYWFMLKKRAKLLYWNRNTFLQVIKFKSLKIGPNLNLLTSKMVGQYKWALRSSYRYARFLEWGPGC